MNSVLDRGRRRDDQRGIADEFRLTETDVLFLET